ncbi:hypothetical protein MKZ38_002189 [Zalerion maritima]|uniref:Zn(2)-C6 fungal-type domain-containing protein n=1 Tax=Zalerion maritima TaxID=339359 RepID=A0AAD5WTA3_9PEZI|nr:hypothetical protein MKZ38_002189 [Zalerion maritima]
MSSSGGGGSGAGGAESGGGGGGGGGAAAGRRLRLGYTKSRNGCARCKQRRVKCDEKRPCSACKRHHVSCSLVISSWPGAASTWVPDTPQAPQDAASTRQELHRIVPTETENPLTSRYHLSKTPKTHPTPTLHLDGGPPTLAAGPGPVPASTIAAVSPASLASSQPSSSAAQSPLPSLDSQSFSSSLSSRYHLALFAQGQGQGHTPNPTNWVADLELMHHWTTTTYLTLPRANELSHVWKTELVKLALTHELVLHQVLAISAFHLGHLRPEEARKWNMIATQHQREAAMGLWRELANITEDNSHALFAASSLLVIGGYAALSTPHHAGDTHKNTPRHPPPPPPPPRPRSESKQKETETEVEGGGKGAKGGENSTSTSSKPTSKGPSIDDLIDIVVLTRGMNVIIKSSEFKYENGRLADLFKLSTYTLPMVFLEVVCEQLDQLRAKIFTNAAKVPPSNAALAGDEISRLDSAIHKSIKTAPIPELRVTMAWPCSIEEGFITLLRKKEHVALVVFVFYCAIIHQAEAKAWYTRGWSQSVAREILGIVDPWWWDVIIWPLGTMGIEVEGAVPAPAVSR